MGPGRGGSASASGWSLSGGGGVRGAVGGGGDGGLLSAPVGLAVDDEFVGGGLEPVDGGLGEEGVGHEAEPLDGFPGRGDDGGGGAVAFDDEFVDGGGVGGVEGLEGEVVEDEQVDAEQLADLGVVAVVEPGRFEASQ